MKCPKCGGTGEMQICEMGFIGKDECDKCHGKGYLNNEEWLHTLNTEQLAECLTKISFNTGYDSYNVVYRKIVEWLRQPKE